MKRKKTFGDFKIKGNKLYLAVKFITEASELLYFSIKARYTAIVILHGNIDKFETIPLIIASCNLSSKINEQSKDLKQIIYVVNYLVSVYEGCSFSQVPVITYSEYVNLKEKAIEVELEILLNNNFDIQVIDLYGMFYDRIKSYYETMNSPIEEYFYRLNSILFSHCVFYLSPVDIFNLIEDDVLYEKTLGPVRELTKYKMDLKTFECKNKEITLSNSLLKKFLKRK